MTLLRKRKCSKCGEYMKLHTLDASMTHKNRYYLAWHCECNFGNFYDIDTETEEVKFL